MQLRQSVKSIGENKMIRKNRYTSRTDFDHDDLHIVISVMNFRDCGINISAIGYTRDSDTIML